MSLLACVAPWNATSWAGVFHLPTVGSSSSSTRLSITPRAVWTPQWLLYPMAPVAFLDFKRFLASRRWAARRPPRRAVLQHSRSPSRQSIHACRYSPKPDRHNGRACWIDPRHANNSSVGRRCLCWHIRHARSHLLLHSGPAGQTSRTVGRQRSPEEIAVFSVCSLYIVHMCRATEFQQNNNASSCNYSQLFDIWHVMCHQCSNNYV